MQGKYIRVIEGPERVWTVLREPETRQLLSFMIKSHAIAYARAVAFSEKVTLFIDDGRGVGIRQSAASLTYPTQLN